MADIEIGAVSAVRVKENEKRVHVDVILSPSRSITAMFQTPYKGIWIVPEQGDAVEVQKVKGEHIARPIQSPTSYSMPSGMQEGDLAIKVDSGTHILLQKQGGGNYNIEMVASGDITIDGIDFDQHTHDYTWTDAGGSGTTDPPQ